MTVFIFAFIKNSLPAVGVVTDRSSIYARQSA